MSNYGRIIFFEETLLLPEPYFSFYDSACVLLWFFIRAFEGLLKMGAWGVLQIHNLYKDSFRWSLAHWLLSTGRVDLSCWNIYNAGFPPLLQQPGEKLCFLTPFVSPETSNMWTPGKCFSRSDVSLYCNLNALKFACPAPARRNWHRNATRNWPSRLLRRTAKEHKLLTTWSKANLKFSCSLRRI